MAFHRRPAVAPVGSASINLFPAAGVPPSRVSSAADVPVIDLYAPTSDLCAAPLAFSVAEKLPPEWERILSKYDLALNPVANVLLPGEALEYPIATLVVLDAEHPEPKAIELELDAVQFSPPVIDLAPDDRFPEPPKTMEFVL